MINHGGIEARRKLIHEAAVLELKCCEHVLPVHEAQLLTYLKLSSKRGGIILNFHVSTLVRAAS